MSKRLDVFDATNVTERIVIVTNPAAFTQLCAADVNRVGLRVSPLNTGLNICYTTNPTLAITMFNGGLQYVNNPNPFTLQYPLDGPLVQQAWFALAFGAVLASFWVQEVSTTDVPCEPTQSPSPYGTPPAVNQSIADLVSANAESVKNQGILLSGISNEH